MPDNNQYDVVIIGSGAGGGTSAWALTKAGLRVLILEAGPAYDPVTDYKLDKPEWEKQDFPVKKGSEGKHVYNVQQPLDSQYQNLRSWNHKSGLINTSNVRRSIGYSHVRGVGGSTLHFTGEAHRMHPDAMQMKSRFGVAADWPVSYEDLEPYYSEAERIVGVAGPKNNSIRWRSEPYPLPAHAPAYSSQKLGEACQSLGISWEPNSVAALSKPYDGRPGCNYCGNCNRGCPRADKGSVDVTFIRKAVATGRCTIKTGCNVTRIEAGNNDKVRSVHYVDPDKGNTEVITEVVIVACGAVETPRLLLNSSNAFASNGLANESGKVGRNFLETSYWSSSGLFPEPLDSHRGLPSDSICWDYNAPDAIPGVIGGCRFSPATSELGLNGPVSYARRVVKSWGREHKKAMRESFGRVLSLGAIGEFLPNPHTYIDLASKQTDRFGLPLARIHSRLTEMNIKRLEFMANKTREILKATGIEDIFEEVGSYDLFNSTHVFGTCRMGTDPNESVVDSYCRSHRWKNLFIVDASVFPSSGGGESPSLTIEALAIRTARHISELAQRREI